MFRIVATVALAAFASLVSPIPAVATTLDYQGYGFETGGFPPSSPGDVLSIPVVVNVASNALGVDFEAEELTGWISGLVSGGVQDGGDAVQFFTFAAGRIEFYRDASRDHDFGINPTSATVPSSFVNGTLCLAGTISDFVLFLDTESNTGAYEGHVVFDEGECLGLLDAVSAEGFTFGGVLTRAAIGDGAVPEGYDMQVDGYLEAQKVPESVCEVECFGIEEARFDFPRPHQRGGRHGDDDDDDDDDDDATGGGPQGGSAIAGAAGGARDGGIADGRRRDRDRDRDRDYKFRIDGELIPCEDTFDPESHEVRIRIGDFTLTLPEGVIRPARRRDCDDDTDGPCWLYSNSRGDETITRFTMQFDEDEGEWDFEIQGRGIDRDDLISDDDLLDLALAIGGTEAVTQAQLVQKKDRLRFVRRRDTCGPGSNRATPGEDATPPAAQPEATPLIADELNTGAIAAAPNPMTDATTIVLRTPAGGSNVRLSIYDVRGRLVRALHSGMVNGGETRFAWDGRDMRGTRVANGIYVYRLESPLQVETRKLVVAR